MSKVTLRVNGHIYSGWQSVSIRRSLSCASGSFELSLCDQPNTSDHALQIRSGDACSVSIDKTPVITGYIDAVQSAFDSSSYHVSISGRDKTGDIVDSSANLKQKSWNGAKLVEFISQLIQPFSIGLKVKTERKLVIPYLAIHGAETVWELIEQASRMCGVICHSDGLGNLVMTEPYQGDGDTSLREGHELVCGSRCSDFSQRFAKYIVEATPYQKGDEEDEAVLPLRVSSHDKEIKRHRELLIISESLAEPRLLKQRADWEKTVRRARSERITVDVLDWKSLGKLWNMNEKVRIESKSLGVDDAYLITEVVFQMGVNEGQKTTLELQPASAFIVDPTLKAQATAKIHEEASGD